MYTKDHLENWMKVALSQAEIAARKGEVPVGAIVVHQGNVISAAHNLIETNISACAHAEIIAINEAGRVLGDWRLNECLLCVTLEPCTMCCGAIKQSRIGTVVFGASDSRFGAAGSLYDLLHSTQNGLQPRVVSGILEAECAQILSNFFELRRKSG